MWFFLPGFFFHLKICEIRHAQKEEILLPFRNNDHHHNPLLHTSVVGRCLWLLLALFDVSALLCRAHNRSNDRRTFTVYLPGDRISHSHSVPFMMEGWCDCNSASDSSSHCVLLSQVLSYVENKRGIATFKYETKNNWKNKETLHKMLETYWNKKGQRPGLVSFTSIRTQPNNIKSRQERNVLSYPLDS